MTKENNKMQVDIDTLKKQNVNDLLSIKELYSKLEGLGEKFRQIKYIDRSLAYKIKKEYEELKNQILDENLQLQFKTLLKENNKVVNDFNERLDNDINEINSQMNNKANRDDVARLSSGTPLFVDSESSMTNNTKNYVNTTDGYLYTYNGTKFVKSNVKYQEMGLSDGQVTRNKTNFYKVSNKGNLFEKDKITAGKYINANNGSWISQADLNESYYIEIDVNKSYKFNFTSHITYFDKELNRIKGYATASVSPDTNVTLLNVPANAKYVRVSVYTSKLDIAVFSEGLFYLFVKDSVFHG